MPPSVLAGREFICQPKRRSVGLDFFPLYRHVCVRLGEMLLAAAVFILLVEVGGQRIEGEAC